MDVVEGLDDLTHGVGCSASQCGVGRGAGQRLLGDEGPHRHRAAPGEGDPSIVHPPVVDPQSDAGRHHPVVTVAAGDLEESPPVPASTGKRTASDEFVGARAVVNTPMKKSAGGDGPRAADAGELDAAVESQQHRGELRRRVGVGDVAADRRADPYLRVGDVADDWGSTGKAAATAALRSSARARAIAPTTTASACTVTLVEGGDSVDVDEDRGAGQADVEQRDEALPTGQYGRLVAELVKHLERVVHRAGPMVREQRWFQPTCVPLPSTGHSVERRPTAL